MSSAPTVSLWRSASLRWSILLTLVIWFVTMTVAFGLVERTQQTLVAGPSASALELESDFLEQLEGERFLHPDFLSSDFVGAIEPLSEREDESFLQALTRYQRALNARLANATPREALELQARQWLLGESVPLGVGEEPVDAYVELISSELPERWEETLRSSLEQRRAEWPEQVSWVALAPPERVRVAIEQWIDRAEAEGDPWCLALAQPAGDLVLWNAELLQEHASEQADFRAFEVRAPRHFGKRSDYCWARVIPLGDHSEVMLGVLATDSFGALLALRDQLGGGFVFTFLLSMLVGGFLGYRIHRRLRFLNVAVDRVRGGHLDERVPVGERGDDFDHLGRNINAMLDRLQELMAGVRAVSDNIAHDLKTPLTRLRHQIEFLAQQEQPSQEGVARVADEADQLLETLTALLRIAQLEQGAFRQPEVRFDLVRLLQDTAELYEPVFTDAGQHLRVRAPDEPVWVSGDRPLWNQALSNLLENTLTHADSGVVLRLDVLDGCAVLEVEDDGPGVPEHEFERVFDRFYRVERSRSKPGTGLGLSLVRAIAEAHDVRVELENRQGLLVRFRWPS